MFVITGFIKKNSKEKENSKCRLRELQQTIDNMNVESVLKEKLTAPLRVSTKQFFVSSDKVSIFSGCSTVLKRESDGLFEYNTDGLIFTPSDFGVGSDKIGQAGLLFQNYLGTFFQMETFEVQYD